MTQSNYLYMQNKQQQIRQKLILSLYAHSGREFIWCDYIVAVVIVAFLKQQLFVCIYQWDIVYDLEEKEMQNKFRWKNQTKIYCFKYSLSF